MKQLFCLMMVVAIASGCNSQTSAIDDTTETPETVETLETPETAVDSSVETSEPAIAYVNFTVDVTTGIYAGPDANITGLNGFYRYNPTTKELENVFFFDQAQNDISEYCENMTLNSDNLGLNGKCVLPGGEYAFGDAVTEANAPEPYPFSYMFDAGPGGEGVGMVTYEPAAVPSQASEDYPEVATVQEVVQGDLMCYVTLTDAEGQEYRIGATFEICEQQDTLLDREVRLSYDTIPVQDCQSIEPCGRVRVERLIVTAEAV
ncbi:MAG: hypothetical protein ACLFV6_01200 [Spirulinaceae cyanobacterium]